ncbi:MAG: hypothetical protein J5691_02875 [Bacilli bacterium]|nr:hypothetical protein [Bacilli bacterium]
MFEYAVYLTVLALALVIANIIANKKVAIFALVLALLCVAMFLSKQIEALNSVYNAIDTTGKYIYYFVFSILASILSIINIIYYSYKRKNINKMFEVASTFDNDKVLAVANKKGVLLKCSSKLENIIDKFDEAPNEFNLSIISIKVDNKEYNKKLLNEFKQILKSIVYTKQEKEVSFTYSNGLTLILNIGLREVEINDKLYGYALFDKNIIASDDYKDAVDKVSKKNTFIYLDMLDCDIAYFDRVVKKYILTNHMFISLGLNVFEGMINSVTKEELAKYIHPEDLPIFNNCKPIDNKVLKVYYRIRLVSDYEWFEESIYNDNLNEFRIIRRVDALVASKVRYGNYKSFIKEIEKLVDNKNGFGIVMINLYSLPKITASIGKEMSDLVVANYFNKILNGILKGSCLVYKVSIIEYALIINDINLLSVIKRDLNEASSFLTSMDVSLNNLNVNMEAEVGIVDTEEVDDVNAKDMARIAFDMLKQASDPAFPKNYSIYSKTTPVNLDYSLADLGINLDEDLSIYDEEDN